MGDQVRGVIAPVSAAEANRLVAGERYEVVFDHLSGGPDGVTANFRLVEPTATRYVGKHEAMRRESEQFPVHEIHVGGLEGGGPVLHRAVETQIDRMSILLASLIGLTKISPQVLGIPAGDKPLATRIRNYLRGY